MSSTIEPPAAGQLDVLTVGHALVDVLTLTDDDFISDEGMAKGSMTLIDDDRAAELYSHMAAGTETSGGSAANTASGVVACGSKAGFVGTVGNDQLGEIFSHDIRAAGVYYPTPAIPGVTTGRSLILITPDGERTMNTNIGASTLVSMAHLSNDLLEASGITYVEGYLLDDAHPIDVWADAIKVIKAAGNKFSVTLSDSFCVQRHRDKFIGLLDGSIDICFGNAEEVCALFEVDDLDVAMTQLEKRCEVAAVTLGSKGSILLAGGSRVEVSAERVEVVDTTGAGDLYAAGVLAGLSQKADLEHCGQLGSKAAAAVISRVGARLTNLG